MLNTNAQSARPFETAHCFALNAMAEKTISGVLSQMMRALSPTTIDVVGIHLEGDLGIERCFAARGPLGKQARNRVRETLNALGGLDASTETSPMIEAPCRLHIEAIRPVDTTLECWYSEFNVDGYKVIFAAFHESASVAQGEERSELQILSKTLEHTLTMLKHKNDAIANQGRQTQCLVRVDIEGIDRIRMHFDRFEQEAILVGITDTLVETIEEVIDVAPANSSSLLAVVPKLATAHFEEVKLRIAEAVRHYPTPEGFPIDAFISPASQNVESETILDTVEFLMPTRPTEGIANSDRRTQTNA